MPVPLFEISLIAVGKIKDQSINEKICDYTNRLRHDIRFSVHEIKDSDKEGEGKKITEVIQKNSSCYIALSEDGREFTSEEFAYYLQKAGRKITFIIGGPNGISAHLKKNVNVIVSLSRMTFTHEMARMLLTEQLYRAVSIIKNRGYHK